MEPCSPASSGAALYLETLWRTIAWMVSPEVAATIGLTLLGASLVLGAIQVYHYTEMLDREDKEQAWHARRAREEAMRNRQYRP